MKNYMSTDFELYLPANEEMSESITQNWTEQAIECYSIDCDCKKCSLANGHYSFICQMPKVIDTLLNTIGEPLQPRKTA
mgnify:CR=1 FL=1